MLSEEKHPGVGERGGIWFGHEVEHPGHGFLTGFVDSAEDDSDLRFMVDEGRVKQIFCSDRFDDWDWLRSFMGDYPLLRVVVARLWEDVVPFTEARSSLPPLTLVARAPTMDLSIFKKRDYISVGTPFDITTIPIHAGLRTRPKDYADDARA